MARSPAHRDDPVEPSHRMPTTLVLSLAAIGAALVAMFGEDDSFTALTVAAALAGLVPWALIAGGVRVPVSLFAAVTLACAAIIMIGDANAGGMFPVMLMVVWVARSGNWRVHATVLSCSLALLVVTAIRVGSAHEAGLVYFAGGAGISWLAGLMLRRQESLTLELQAMSELRIEHAASAERARIAREVHDVVAHSLTVVMLHLTGARRAISTEPARAAEALDRAESVGRESLDSIRQVMGVLRERHSGREAASPGLADLGSLIDRYRMGGLGVDITVDPSIEVDPAVGLVVYRIVQESLTNVLRHAPGASCSVNVSAGPEQPLSVEIGNGPPPDGRGTDQPSEGRRGFGVRGMAERVHAVGGELVTGATAHGGWHVTVTIPSGRVAPGVTAIGVAAVPQDAWPQPTGR